MTMPMTGGGQGFPVFAAGPVQYLAGYDHPVTSLARWVLKTIEDVYAEAEVELPTRRVLTIGSVAVDEPVLAIMFGGLTVGPPGNELMSPMHGDSPQTAVFNVELWRPEPTLGPRGLIPTAMEESAAAEAVMQDTWLLGQAAFRTDQMGVGVIWRIAVNDPQGGMVGVSLTLDVQVP